MYGELYVISTLIMHMPHSDSTVSADAGIESRTVATLALALTVRRSIRLDLIHENIQPRMSIVSET